MVVIGVTESVFLLTEDPATGVFSELLRPTISLVIRCCKASLSVASEAVLREVFLLSRTSEVFVLLWPKTSPANRCWESSSFVSSETLLDAGFFLPRVAEVFSVLFGVYRSPFNRCWESLRLMAFEELLDDDIFLPRVAERWAGLVYKLLMVVTTESLVYLLGVLTCRLLERGEGVTKVCDVLESWVWRLDGGGGGSFFLREGDEGAPSLLLFWLSGSFVLFWLGSDDAWGSVTLLFFAGTNVLEGSDVAVPFETTVGEQGGGSLGEEAGRWLFILLVLLAGLPGKNRLLDGLLGISGNSHSLSSSASDSVR